MDHPPPAAKTSKPTTHRNAYADTHTAKSFSQPILPSISITIQSGAYYLHSPADRHIAHRIPLTSTKAMQHNVTHTQHQHHLPPCRSIPANANGSGTVSLRNLKNTKPHLSQQCGSFLFLGFLFFLTHKKIMIALLPFFPCSTVYAIMCFIRSFP
jgi:hypothetical protein